MFFSVDGVVKPLSHRQKQRAAKRALKKAAKKEKLEIKKQKKTNAQATELTQLKTSSFTNDNSKKKSVPIKNKEFKTKESNTQANSIAKQIHSTLETNKIINISDQNGKLNNIKNVTKKPNQFIVTPSKSVRSDISENTSELDRKVNGKKRKIPVENSSEAGTIKMKPL